MSSKIKIAGILSSRATPPIVAKLGQLLFALIIQDPAKNVRDKSAIHTEADVKRNARLRRENVESIAAGIDPTDEIMVYAATADEIDAELQKRANRLASMSGWLFDHYASLWTFDAANPDHADCQNRQIVGTPPQGNAVEFDLIVPRYMVLDGNQRADNFAEAQLVRQGLLADAYKAFPIENAKQPEIGFYATECERPINDQERELWQTRDNMLESRGFQALTLAEQLTTAVSTVKNGGNEASLTEPRGPFKRGTAQKMYRWATICVRYPKLDVQGRAKLNPTDPRFVDLRAADYKRLDEAFSLNAPGPKLSLNEAETALQSVKASRSNVGASMDRKGIEGMAEGNDSQLVQLVAKAILNPTSSEILTALGQQAATHNAVLYILAHGTPEAKAALDAVCSTYAADHYVNAGEIEVDVDEAKPDVDVDVDEAKPAKRSKSHA